MNQQISDKNLLTKDYLQSQGYLTHKSLEIYLNGYVSRAELEKIIEQIMSGSGSGDSNVSSGPEGSGLESEGSEESWNLAGFENSNYEHADATTAVNDDSCGVNVEIHNEGELTSIYHITSGGTEIDKVRIYLPQGVCHQIQVEYNDSGRKPMVRVEDPEGTIINASCAWNNLLLDVYNYVDIDIRNNDHPDLCDIYIEICHYDNLEQKYMAFWIGKEYVEGDNHVEVYVME